MVEQLDSDIPLHSAPLKVGIVYNLKKEKMPLHDDEEAEYDSISTVYAIRDVFERHGYMVCLLEADGELPDKLKNSGIDIAFNIAEGIRGRGREAEIPALLNLYGIPFTGSDETTLCLALDKALTKRLLRSYHIKTPDYAVCSSTSVRQKNIRYPAIVKPNAEGSSKGIREKCVVNNSAELMELLHGELETYQQEKLQSIFFGAFVRFYLIFVTPLVETPDTMSVATAAYILMGKLYPTIPVAQGTPVCFFHFVDFIVLLYFAKEKCSILINYLDNFASKYKEDWVKINNRKQKQDSYNPQKLVTNS